MGYFVDGAFHVCQTAGICEARKYTCEECVQGLFWVEAYLEDPIMIAEMTMEKFMIPSEICNNEPVCTGETPHPTHPHPTHPPHSSHHPTPPHSTHPDSLL